MPPPLLRFLLLALAMVGAAVSAQSSPQRPPNIVLVMADDLGWGELGCYGQEKIRTPCLDRLAREGMRFTRCYSGSPVCAPSRCVLLTGRHTGHAFVRDNFEVGGWKEGDPEGQMPLPRGTVTLTSRLKRAGYATAAIGKWGLGGPGSTGAPEHHGVDLFYGYLCQRQAHNHYPTHLWRNGEKVPLEGNRWKNLVGEHYAHDLMVDEALRFVREHRDEPFFLYLPFHIPHVALQVPEEEIAAYEGAFAETPYDGRKGYLKHPKPRAAYAGMITRMDRDIGRIVDLIDASGIRENTLVLFTSDNGPTYAGGADWKYFESAGPWRGLKGSLFEGGIRVPLIARWTGRVRPRSVSSLMVAFQDFLPTLLEVASAAPESGIDGLSFVPTLLGRAGQRRHELLYWEHVRKQALHQGRWKLIRQWDRKNRLRRTLLFDLERDPGERRNLARERPDLVRRLAATAARQRTPSPEFPRPFLDG